MGTALLQLWNAMPHQHFWHLLRDRGSAPQESRCSLQVCSGYLFEYYQLWDTAARHAGHPKHWWTEFYLMHKYQAQLSLWKEADHVHHTTNSECSSCSKSGDFLCQRCPPVPNRGAPDLEDVSNDTVYIQRYPSSMMFRRYVNDLQSDYYPEAQIKSREEHFQHICCMKWLDFEVVQSTPQTLIYPHVCLLAKRLSPLKVTCWLELMTWISLFWVLAMLIEQSSCIAIWFPTCIFHSNYLAMSFCMCWIRGTCQMSCQVVYSLFIGSIFRRRCTMYIVYGQITCWLDHQWPFRSTDRCLTILSWADPTLQVVPSCQLKARY